MPAQEQTEAHDATVKVHYRASGSFEEADEVRVDVIGEDERWVLSTYQPNAERVERGGIVPEAVESDDVPQWVRQALDSVGAAWVVL